MAIARNDAMVESLLTSAATGTQNFARWRAVQNGSAGFNYAVPRGGRVFRGKLDRRCVQPVGRLDSGGVSLVTAQPD